MSRHRDRARRHDDVARAWLHEVCGYQRVGDYSKRQVADDIKDRYAGGWAQFVRDVDAGAHDEVTP